MRTIFSSLILFLAINSFGQDGVYYKGCLDSLRILDTYAPNGHSGNDQLTIHFPCPPSNFSIKVFNRWGEEIFQSTDPNFKWDFVADERLVESGVYFYVVSYQFMDEQKDFSGNFTLIR
jgi:gliding motility-associated-like protein